MEVEFGMQKALDFLVAKKFLDFIVAAEHDSHFRLELPAFATRIKEIFESWQLAQYLETESLDPDVSVNDTIYSRNRESIHPCTRDLLLVERARAWLVGDAE